MRTTAWAFPARMLRRALGRWRDGPAAGLDRGAFPPPPAVWSEAAHTRLWPPETSDNRVRARSGWTGFSAQLIAPVPVPEIRTLPGARPGAVDVLVIPGGAFSFLSVAEALAPAIRLADLGYRVHLLLHRLPHQGAGAGHAAMVADAARAVRRLRADRRAGGEDPAAVAVLGLSAGGHLAAHLCTQRVAEPPPTVHRPDAVDAESPRPSAVGFASAVASLAASCPPEISARAAGVFAPPQRLARLDPTTQLASPPPPAFIAHAADDPLIPVAHASQLASAWRKAGRPAELHVFPVGGHGLNGQAAGWIDAFVSWLARPDGGACPPGDPPHAEPQG